MDQAQHKHVVMRFFIGEIKELEQTTNLERPSESFLTSNPGVLFKVTFVDNMEDVQYYIDKVFRERRPNEPYFVHYELVDGYRCTYTASLDEVKRFLEGS